MIHLIEDLHPFAIIEGGAKIELPIRRKGDVAHASLAVVHLLQHHPVRQKVELRGLALLVEAKQNGVPLVQDLLVGFNLFISELLHIGNAKIDSCA